MTLSSCLIDKSRQSYHACLSCIDGKPLGIIGNGYLPALHLILDQVGNVYRRAVRSEGHLCLLYLDFRSRSLLFLRFLLLASYGRKEQSCGSIKQIPYFHSIRFSQF